MYGSTFRTRSIDRMIAEGITPEWGAQVRTETVNDDELLGLMRRSNCFNLYVGFESINPKTLRLFKMKQGPVFEPFARIGLLFTENLDRIRQAYTRAGEMLGLWGDGPAAARLVAARTSKG
jgi:hypothetical protein